MLGWKEEDLQQYAFCHGGSDLYAVERGRNQRIHVYCVTLGGLIGKYIRNPRLKPLDEREQVDLLGRLRRDSCDALQIVGIYPQQIENGIRDVETAIAAFTVVAKPKSYGLLLNPRVGATPDRIECARVRDNHPEAFRSFLSEARQRVVSGPRRDNIFTELLPRPRA